MAALPRKGQEPEMNDGLLELMIRYAAFGFRDWNENANRPAKDMAMRCLRNNIVESDWDAQDQVRRAVNGGGSKFLPVPMHRHRGIGRCFFLPRTTGQPGAGSLAFDLVLMIVRQNEAAGRDDGLDGNAALAFRFEAPEPDDENHDYPHVQLCRKVARREFDVVGVPEWIPDSYPAFPLPCSNPLHLFLAMMLAVHGHGGGVDTVLQNIFTDTGRLTLIRQYLDDVDAMLGRRTDAGAAGSR